MVQRIREATALGLPLGSEEWLRRIEEDFRIEARRKRAGRKVKSRGKLKLPKSRTEGEGK